MFSCTKCGLSLHIEHATIQDKILTLNVRCLNGHKGVRRIAEHQANEIAGDVFSRMLTCLECGRDMSQLGTDIHEGIAESIFLCPVHGPQVREFPSQYLGPITIAASDVDPTQAILDSFHCPECGQLSAISEIESRNGMLVMELRCANGHKSKRYIPSQLDESIMKKLLQRLVNCDKCGLPGHIADSEDRRKATRLHVVCPTHGITKKDIPSDFEEQVKEAVSEIPDDAVVRAMLTTTNCRLPLAIISIEDHKMGYKFKTECPGGGSVPDMIVQMKWNEPTNRLITKSLLTCGECGLLTHILDVRKRRKATEFRIVCPIHGVMKRDVSRDIFDIIREEEPKLDRIPSIIRSMNCTKCNSTLYLRDVEEKRGLIEFELDDKNGHRTKRFFVPKLPKETLVDVYKNMFQCPECHNPLDLVYTTPGSRESRVVLLCSLHGKYVLDVPHDHAEAYKLAYDEILQDRAKPPEEAIEEEPKMELEPEVKSIDTLRPGIHVFRGCEIIGGKFDYKVKIQNDTEYVITNVTVSIVAYPMDCMDLGGESVKTISRIEVGGFRSPQFTFYPTKDCVQGKVVATVSYIDFKDQLHTLQVEPYIIRSVCDLLQPSEKSTKEFDMILGSLTETHQEQTLDWNPQVLFTKAEKLLPAKNFHIVDKEEKIAGGQFIGTLRGFAEGKYTQKKVAVVFLITGPEHGRHASLKVEALGEDIAMLPTTIDELADTMDSWICLRCGAPLLPEQIEELGKRTPIRCVYCSHTLTIALYLK